MAKKSMADCSSCPLVEYKGVGLFKTSNPSNLELVKNYYLVSHPQEMETLELVLKKTTTPYFITSVYLCDAPKDKTTLINDKCSPNFLYFLKTIDPNKVILFGELSKSMKGIIERDSKCKIFYFDSIDDFQNVISIKKEPKKIEERKSEDCQSNNITESNIVKSSDSSEPYRFKIPEKFYTDEYRLVDVQYITMKNQLIFIFRDSKNQKIFYEPPMRHENYYWYESAGTSNYIENISNLKLCIGNYREKRSTINCYESDIKIDVKHAIDYYLQSKGEPSVIKKNVLYFDIEIYTFRDEVFPSPAKAEYPINAISFQLDDAEVQTYLFVIPNEVNPKIYSDEYKKKFPNVKLFNDESNMLLEFFHQINHILKPDILSGWNNSGFDIPYIVNRMKKLGIHASKLSPYGNVYVDDKYRNCTITGYIVYDQLTLYKGLTYTEEPSYTLNAISQKVTGRGKVKYEGSLYALYRDDIFLFTEYSIVDVICLSEIEKKKQHISTQDELRKYATTTHFGASTTTGQTDGLTLTLLRKQGQTYRIAIPGQKKEIAGGFVFESSGGLYKGLLCDFDFTSLYPSIINSFNIGPNTYLGKIDSVLAYRYLHTNDELKKDPNRTYTWQANRTFAGKIPKDSILNKLTENINYSQLQQLVDEYNATVCITGTVFMGHNKELSVFYQIISRLFSSRKEFKSKMLNAKEAGDKGSEIIYDCKQLAVKIMMNSLYGVLANPYFRFYDPSLAESVTLSGQELLKWSTVHADAFMKNCPVKLGSFIQSVQDGLKYVIYGDTDSLFINLTDYFGLKKIPLDLQDPVNFQKIQDEIKLIQDHINNVALSNYIKAHNIPKEKSMLFIKNEFLFDKYYALNAKKKYAMHVIAQEGKNVNFMDIKGLDIKRSDISEYTRTVLKEILKMVFDLEPIHKIEDFVNRKREEAKMLILRGDPVVAKSVNFSKDASDYKNLPQHIKAMKCWNLIVKDDFKHGEKGRIFTIRGIDLEEAPEDIRSNYQNRFLKEFQPEDLTAMVIPTDVDYLPRYFKPDLNKMLESVVNEKANLLLEPLLKKKTSLTW